jgi:hypothetical protein
MSPRGGTEAHADTEAVRRRALEETFGGERARRYIATAPELLLLKDDYIRNTAQYLQQLLGRAGAIHAVDCAPRLLGTPPRCGELLHVRWWAWRRAHETRTGHSLEAHTRVETVEGRSRRQRSPPHPPGDRGRAGVHTPSSGSFSTYGHLSAAQGSSTTVSRSDIRLIQHLDSSLCSLMVRRWRLIGHFLILYYPWLGQPLLGIPPAKDGRLTARVLFCPPPA